MQLFRARSQARPVYDSARSIEAAAAAAQKNGEMDLARAETLNVVAQAAVDTAIPVDPIEGVDGGLTARSPSHSP